MYRFEKEKQKNFSFERRVKVNTLPENQKTLIEYFVGIQANIPSVF